MDFLIYIKVESLDSYLSEKLNAIEVAYPIITKPTEKLYAENLKTKVETAKSLIKYGADKVSDIKTLTENVYNSTLKAPVNAVIIF